MEQGEQAASHEMKDHPPSEGRVGQRWSMATQSSLALRATTSLDSF